METITYSLLDGRKRSDHYYQDVAAFAVEALGEAESRLSALIGAFIASSPSLDLGEDGARMAAAFDLLTLGTLWRVYGGRIPQVKPSRRGWFTWLAALREKSPLLKELSDALRGLLAARLLAPRPPQVDGIRPLSLPGLDRLLDWMQASADFDEEVRRLRTWRDFLAGQPAALLEQIGDLAAWFERHSEAALGRYTPNVERFLAEEHPSHRLREDAIFCGRARVEYHLNMVGGQLLNLAFRPAFLSTAARVVIVPPCMRYQPEEKCKARQTSSGALCASCTPACRINQLTLLGRKHGFQVLIMPDELAVFASKAEPDGSKVLPGVVGVSCALTNAPGGWKTHRLGVPAQGVLLDYCGCSFHWHRKGFPTDVNFARVLEVVGAKKDG